MTDTDSGAADRSPTEFLAQFAEAAFGPDWAGPLSHFTGINPRTCQRIRKAADVGEAYPAARGVLTKLAERAAELAAATAPFRDQGAEP